MEGLFTPEARHVLALSILSKLQGDHKQIHRPLWMWECMRSGVAPMHNESKFTADIEYPLIAFGYIVVNPDPQRTYIGVTDKGQSAISMWIATCQGGDA